MASEILAFNPNKKVLYVSYQNDDYVLDLFGLASKEALNHRRKKDKADWMDSFSKKYNVKLAMIYDG